MVSIGFCRRAALQCSAILFSMSLGLPGFPVASARADILTLEVSVERDVVAVGQEVRWSVWAVASETSADNFGIATITGDLMDSMGEQLLPGEIGEPFLDYGFRSGGTWDANAGILLEITAVLFSQDNSRAEAVDPRNKSGSNLGPLLFASGAYVAVRPGGHELNVSGGSLNSYFTSTGQLNGGANRVFDLRVVSAGFLVVAVPEPCSGFSVGLVMVLVSQCGGRTRRV